MNNTREQLCIPICFFSVLALFTGIIFIPSTLKYVETMNLIEKECNITSISYPTVYPSESNLEGWKSCDCGYNCASLTSCIQLYTIINNTIKKISQTNKNIYNDCTFYDDSCTNGENPIFVNKEIEEALETYIRYINETVDCFYNTEKDTLYLEKDTNSRRVMIVSGTIMGMFISFLLLIYICIYVEERREKKYNLKSLQI
jgi:hypothetical protein